MRGVSGSSKTPNSKLIFISVISAIQPDYNEKANGQVTHKHYLSVGLPINKGVFMGALLIKGFRVSGDYCHSMVAGGFEVIS